MIITESLLDVRQNQGKDLSARDFAKLVQCEPYLSEIGELTDETMKDINESYMKWLINMFKNGQLKGQQPENVRTLLKTFDMAKKRRNLLTNNDINSYKSLDYLKQELENIKDNLSIRQKKQRC